VNRNELLSERANKLSGEKKKALRYLLPPNFPYIPANFLIIGDSDDDYNLLVEQVAHLESLPASK
jgi:hypothetical protein